MIVLEATLLFITLVIISNIISHYIVGLPTALIEIIVGVIVALIFNINIELQTDWFMLLFVAPLLFSDAKHFPKKELWELRAPIFANAILLVFLTTIAGGFIINILVPELSLTLSFALAALLSPTDPVAVQGIAEQVKLPQKMMNLISGESLLNDASGLIAFKYALAAFLTGSFSLQQAAGDFFYITLSGIVIGFIVIHAIHLLQQIFIKQGIQDVTLHASLQLMTPFIIFVIAELFQASGVIAVFVGGVVASQQTTLFRGPYSEIKIVTDRVWEMIIYLLNGIVFVMLGTLLPYAMSAAIINPSINNGRLVIYVLAIWFILMFIRTSWSYGYMWYEYIKNKKNSDKPSFEIAILIGITGVRGAVTMAMALSIPFVLNNGELFVERYLLIFLSGGVIMTSILVAVIMTPIITKEKKRIVLSGSEISTDILNHEDSLKKDSLTEIEARKLMVKHAISYLKENATPNNQVVLNDILRELDTQLKYLYLDDDITSNDFYYNLEQRYRLIALEAEEQKCLELLKSGPFSLEFIVAYSKMIEQKKLADANNSLALIKRQLNEMRMKIRPLILKKTIKKQEIDPIELSAIEIESYRYTLKMLVQTKKELDPLDNCYLVKTHIINQLMMEYQGKINRIQYSKFQKHSNYQQQYKDYVLQALDEERRVIQHLLEQRKISVALSTTLRQAINYRETSFLEGINE